MLIIQVIIQQLRNGLILYISRYKQGQRRMVMLYRYFRFGSLINIYLNLHSRNIFLKLLNYQMIKEAAYLLFVLLALLLGWSFYQKSQWPIDYTAFTPQVVDLQPIDYSFQQHIIPKYFADALVINDTLKLRAPEDVAVADDGTIYSGLEDGIVAKISPEGHIQHLIQFNQTGQIYGIILTRDQSTLYFVTELQGLMKLDLANLTHTVLLKYLNGRKLVLNSVTIDEESSTLYITNSGPISMRYSNKQVLMKHRKGQVISFDLKTGQATVIADKIAFANGIVYEAATQSVLFSELSLHRIVRLFVGGLRKGQQQILIDNLFGFGDNLKLNQKGELLVAFPALRDYLPQLISKYPAVVKYLLYLPERLFTALVKKRAGGVKIDTKTGEIIEYLLGGPAKTFFVTSIVQKKGKTYFSSLRSHAILVLNNTSKPKVSLVGEQSSDL